MIERVAIRGNNSRLQMTMMMMKEKMDVRVRKNHKAEIRIFGCSIFSSKVALLFGTTIYAH